MNGWLGSRWAGNSVWSPPSIRETEKGTFNPVGSLRCHRQKEMHSFSFSHLFHENWRKRRGKMRREESNGEEGGGGWRKNCNWCKKKVDNTTDPSPGPYLGSQSHWECAAMQHCECWHRAVLCMWECDNANEAEANLHDYLLRSACVCLITNGIYRWRWLIYAENHKQVTIETFVCTCASVFVCVCVCVCVIK